jgi:hypothetical protein
MTVGTGFFGRSSVAENVGPQHLIQWVKLAWNKDERIKMPEALGGRSGPGGQGGPHLRRPHKGEIDYDFGNPPPGVAPVQKEDEGDIRAEIRKIILEELRSMRAGK